MVGALIAASLTAAAALLLAALAAGEEQCQDSQGSSGSAVVGHGGLCPAFELTCPPCPITHVKCPMGGCQLSIRECPPNVNVRGDCNGTHCTSIEWCHLHEAKDYACWEHGVASQQLASMRFSAIAADACNYCTSVRSRYPCNNCCGKAAIARWRGRHRLGSGAVPLEPCL